MSAIESSRVATERPTPEEGAKGRVVPGELLALPQMSQRNGQRGRASSQR